MRRSHNGWWPHLLWAKDLKGLVVEQFVPVNSYTWEDLPWWKKIFPFHVLIFRGMLRHDDD